MTPAKLPEDINQDRRLPRRAAKGYGGRLKWNEVAKLKSDMMQMRGRWNVNRVSGWALSKKCRGAGLSHEDTALVIDLLRRVQAGGHLVPQSNYRGFQFLFPLNAAVQQSQAG